MGKTAFVLNVVDYVSVRKNLPCMVFSLEMSKEQLVNRMLSMESNVDSQKLRTGTLTDADWDAVVEGIGVIGNSKLIIPDVGGTAYGGRGCSGNEPVLYDPCIWSIHYKPEYSPWTSP